MVERAKGRLTGIPVLKICLVVNNMRALLTNWSSASKTYEKSWAACQQMQLGLGRIQAETKTKESPWMKGLG